MKMIYPPKDKKEYDSAAISLKLCYAPRTYACGTCGWPVIDGYTCTTCGSENPREDNGNSERYEYP